MHHQAKRPRSRPLSFFSPTNRHEAQSQLRHGAGVCCDFAHVGIALCRSLHIPARIEVGYLQRLKPMDLHAGFEAFVGGRQHTFDATQQAPRGGRIVMAYGRNAADGAFISDHAALPLQVSGMRVEVVEVKLWRTPVAGVRLASAILLIAHGPRICCPKSPFHTKACSHAREA